MDVEEYIFRNATLTDIPRLLELEKISWDSKTRYNEEKMMKIINMYPEGQFIINMYPEGQFIMEKDEKIIAVEI